MKHAKVVIGANYGDEGKGLTTDYFAAQHGESALVVRFNGGAQAGHTVTAPDGRRHVFSHFGSGSFCGAPTFLSHFFVCNPLLFVKEHALLAEKSVSPVVHVDASAPVTTPYDMMINQIAEESRGITRHGSCGMGFGETLERGLNAEFALGYGDLKDTAALRRKLDIIRKEWLPRRLQALGITNPATVWQERINAGGVLEKFIDDTKFFLDTTLAAAPDYLVTTKAQIVFEGAQGLLLDQARGFFPHVTRSHTGIRNALGLATAAGIDSLDVAYITRAYLTRHGAGPLALELPAAPSPKIEDKTNITNPYQGSLRFSHLDINQLQNSIDADFADCTGGIRVRKGLVVTCLDQMEQDITYIENSATETTDAAGLLGRLRGLVKPDFVLTSQGPTRSTIAAA